MGWFVYARQKNGTNQQTNSVSEVQPEKQEEQKIEPAPETSEPTVDTSVHKVQISMIDESDISKLPDYTPANFKSFMAKLLKENQPDTDSGCIFAYGIDRISQFNIAGGYSPTGENIRPNTNKYDCISGGAPILWVVTPDNTWESAGGNGVDCETKNGGLVYEEFASHCHINKGSSFIKNPNGSIESLTQ